MWKGYLIPSRLSSYIGINAPLESLYGKNDPVKIYFVFKTCVLALPMNLPGMIDGCNLHISLFDMSSHLMKTGRAIVHVGV